MRREKEEVFSGSAAPHNAPPRLLNSITLVALVKGTALAKKQKQLDARQEVMLGFAEAAAARAQHFFYLLIPEPLGPVDRGEKYEDPLGVALGALGEVTGGGSQVGEGDTIAFCGLDVVVNDRDRALKVIRQCLRSCGAPPNTTIEEYVPEFVQLPL